MIGRGPCSVSLICLAWGEQGEPAWAALLSTVAVVAEQLEVAERVGAAGGDGYAVMYL